MKMKVNYINAKEEIKVEKQKTTKYIDKYNQLVVKQNIVEVNNKKYIDSITKAFHQGSNKKTKSVIFIAGELKIDTLIIPYHDTIPYYIDSFKHRRKFKFANDCFITDGYVDTLGVTINNFSAKDSILLLEKEQGFLVKHSELTIVSKNPCKEINTVKSYKTKQRPSKGLKIFSILVSFFVGYQLSNL